METSHIRQEWTLPSRVFPQIHLSSLHETLKMRNHGEVKLLRIAALRCLWLMVSISYAKLVNARLETRGFHFIRDSFV